MAKYKLISTIHTSNEFGYLQEMSSIGDIIEGTPSMHIAKGYLILKYERWTYHLDDLKLIPEFNLKDIYAQI